MNPTSSSPRNDLPPDESVINSDSGESVSKQSSNATGDNFGLPSSSKPDWRSLTISSGFHILVVVILVLMGMKAKVGAGSPEVRRVDLVLQTVNNKNEVEYLTEAAATEQTENLSESAAESSPPVETLDQLEPLDQTAMPAFDLPKFDAAGMTQVPSTERNTGKQIELTDAQKEMIAADRARFEAAAKRGSEVSINVFGSGELSGRKFVFVLDRSKSMGSQGLGVLSLAASQLSEAVGVLQPNHQFQVVAYHHKTALIDNRQLINATAENKEKVGAFIEDLAAFGSTQHESALTTALSLRPDIIVLMTDGGRPFLNRSQLDTIRRLAGSTQIHCIEFGSGPRQNRGGFMETLASENDGSYRYLDVVEWNKNN